MSKQPSKDRSLLLLVVAVVVLLSWISAPRLLRHFAHVEPLFFSTSELDAVEPAGGRAYVAELDPSPWQERWVELSENGRALTWSGDRQRVRQEGAGLFHHNPRGLLFAASDDSDPKSNGRRYLVRRPRDLSSGIGLGLVLGFTVLHGLLAFLVADGLRRSLSRHRVTRLVLGIALTAATATLSLFVLGRVLPVSDFDTLGERLNQYRSLRHRIDTIFLGSSRIYRHLDPLVFSRVLTENGKSAEAFNLGMPDMRMLEVLYFAEQILETSSGRIERLVVECEPDPLFLREANRGTIRVIRWHDFRTLRRALPEIFRTEPSWARRSLLAYERVSAFAHRFASPGRGVDAVKQWLRRQPRWIDPARRGFLALDEELADPASEVDRLDLVRRYSELHDRTAEWQRTVERLRRTEMGGQLKDRFELELFRQLQALADRHRVELVFVLSPNPVRHPNLIHAAEIGVVERLIRFDDPDAYADFYSLASRFDRHHLNGTAARRMTRMLAERMLDQSAPSAALGPAP